MRIGVCVNTLHTTHSDGPLISLVKEKSDYYFYF